MKNTGEQQDKNGQKTGKTPDLVKAGAGKPPQKAR